jgi:phosphatidate cytidylyltransferase
MQYLVGSFIGKTPFYPNISPKKTWEGTIGGSLLAIILCALVYYFTQHNIKTGIAIGLIASIGGTMGDLVESKFKRLCGIKDSGNILPGHGGFLDRFDSLLMAAPLLWWYLKTIGG